MAKTQETCTISIGQLEAFPENPREMVPEEFENLKRSLKQYGYVDMLIIDDQNRVVGGNQRFQALLDLMETHEIDIDPNIKVVRLSGYTEEELIGLNIALNKISGEWNYQLLRKQLLESQSQWQFTGFNEDELQLLTQKLETAREELVEKSEDLKDYKPPNQRYVVMMSFLSPEAGDQFLEEHGYDQRFRGKRTVHVMAQE